MNSRNPARTTIINWLLLFVLLYGAALAIYAPLLTSPFGGTEYKTFLLPLQEGSLTTVEYLTKWSPEAAKEVKFSRPLLKLLLLIEHPLWGHNPLPYRLFSLLIHVGCGLAATAIVLTAPGRRPLAWLAGLLLVVHPAAVPAVRWISARGDLTATFFSLLALWALFRLIVENQKPVPVLRALIPGLFVLLALSAKELGLANFIALPLVWFLWPGGTRYRRTSMVLFSSLAGLLLAYFGWRLLIFSGIGGYGMIPGFDQWPRRLGVLLWQTTGAYLIPGLWLRSLYLALLIALVILVNGGSARRWRRSGVLALLLAVYGFQSIIAGIQDIYYAYAPAAILAVLLVSALVELRATTRGRAMALVILLLLPLIGLQAHTAATTNMNRSVELEVSERLMEAIGEKEGQLADGALFLLRLEGQERDIRIRDQSKIINVYFRYLRGREGPAIRRNPKKLPPDPPVLVWDGINITLQPPRR